MKLLLRLPRWAPAVLLFALAYFSVDAMLGLIRWRLHLRSLPISLRKELTPLQQGILYIACALYGAWRAGVFHPIYRNGYLRWLRTTPWHAGMALPLGPITLAWWDVPVLGGAAALAHWHAHESVVLPLLAFVCVYLVISMIALAATARWESYIIALGSAFIARYWLVPSVAVGFAAALLVVSQFGLYRSVRMFPWDGKPKDLTMAESTGSPTAALRDCTPAIPVVSALLACILIGTWTWTLMALNDVRASPANISILLCTLAGSGAFLRVLIYCAAYHPPITLLGRLVSGRLIIPGYDYVLLAPAAAPVVAIVLPRSLANLGAQAPVAIAVTVATCLFLLLSLPPTLRKWQLIGSHRAVGMAAGQRMARA